MSLHDFYRDLLGDCRRAFDIGAYVGDHTAALRQVGLDVLAIEPNDYAFHLLQRRFAADKKILAVQVAVGDKCESGAWLRTSSLHATLCTLSDTYVAKTQASGRFAGVSWDGGCETTMVSLQSLMKVFGEPPDFVKIDVEGYEPKVIAGLYSNDIKLLSFEFAAELPQNYLSCITRLSDLGYTRFAVCEGWERWPGCLEWRTESSATDYLAQLVAKNPLAWGDIYVAQ